MGNEDRVELLSIRAYDMFPTKNEPDNYVADPFPMYSYESAAAEFWKSAIAKMVNEGLTDREIESLLRSKKMRWMFDSVTNEFDELVNKLITPAMIEGARS